MQPSHNPKTQAIDYDSIMKSIKIDNHQSNKQNSNNTYPGFASLGSFERQAYRGSKYLHKDKDNKKDKDKQKQKQTDYSLSMSISTNKSLGRSSMKPMSRHKSIQKQKISVEKYLIDKMMYQRNNCVQNKDGLLYSNGSEARNKNISDFQSYSKSRQSKNLSYNYSQHCLHSNQQQHRHIPSKFSFLHNDQAYQRANSKQPIPKPSKYLQLIKKNPKFPHIVTEQDKRKQKPSEPHQKQTKFPSSHNINPNHNNNIISNITFSQLNLNPNSNNCNNSINTIMNMDVYMNNMNNKNRNANYVYSSIVFDDLSKQSCFQSVCRAEQGRQDVRHHENYYANRRVYEDHQYNTKRSNQQFILHDNSISKKRSSKNINNPIYEKWKDQQAKDRKIMIKTPNKFKKFKTMATSQVTQNSHQADYCENDKQNNTHLHNRCQNRANNFQKVQSHILDKQARYLTHTETSQKKIKQRRQTRESKNIQPQNQIKKGLLFVNNSQTSKGKNIVHRPGIQIINEKHYQS